MTSRPLSASESLTACSRIPALKLLQALTVAAAVAATGAASAASLTDSGYSQNFDSMGTSGTAPPSAWALYTGPSGTSNSTWTTSIPASGVAALTPTTGSLTATSAPTATNNNGYNAALSPSNTSDRVLAASPTLVSGAALQLTLTNDTGAALDGLGLSFDTVRFTAAGTVNELPGYWLFYSVNGGSSWTNVSSLNPTIATVPNKVGVTSTSGSFDFSAPVAAGGAFELRWVDDNAQQTSPDQIIGLNNVNISPVPLPATLPLFISALGGLGFLARRSRKVALAG